MALSDTDRAILDFEAAATWWKYRGSYEAEIRQRFDLGPTSYHQQLARLLADQDAAAYAPDTVRRLRARVLERGAHRQRRNAPASDSREPDAGASY